MMQGSFLRPTSLEDAVRLLQRRSTAQPIAGGQALIPAYRKAGTTPAETLIGIDQLGALQGISSAGDRLRIGAAETHSAIASSKIVQGDIPALADLACSIGDAQIRNRGTIGGALVSNFQHTDYSAALYALSATIHTTERDIRPNAFASQDGTPLISHDELVVSISFCVPKSANYVRLEHAAGGYAELGLMCAKMTEGSLTTLGLVGHSFSPICLELSANLELSSAADALAEAANLSAYHHARLVALLNQAEEGR